MHWTRLDVAIWNGIELTGGNRTIPTMYDTQSIYSGSATVLPGLAPDGVSDGIMQIYPGLCRKADWANCTTGTLLAAAVPADYATDPLLKRWHKLVVVVEGTQRDPSSAFKMDSGERRFRTVDAVVYGAASDKDFGAGRLYRVGASNMPVEECPSVYGLPTATAGFQLEYEQQRVSGSLSTHVFKYGARPTDPLFKRHRQGGDAYVLGSYPLDAAQRSMVNATFSSKPLRVDNGKYYASTDTILPGDRRVNFGCAEHVAVGGSGPESLPRQVSYNAQLDQLQWALLSELKQLRESVLLNLSDIKLKRCEDLRLPSNTAAQAEVIATFALPAKDVRFSLHVSCGVDGSNCTEIYVQGLADPDTVLVGVVPAVQSTVSDTLPQNTTLRLAVGERHIEVRVFVDHIIGEAFFQQGRETFTFDVKPVSTTSRMMLCTSMAVVVPKLTVWQLGSIWVSEVEVLATPRMDFSHITHCL